MKDEIKPLVFKLLITSNKSKPIDAKTIKLIVKNKLNLQTFSEVEVRKIINELRREEFPVIATNRGYYTSYEESDIEEQIVSMMLRIKSQENAIEGLKNLLINIRNDK